MARTSLITLIALVEIFCIDSASATRNQRISCKVTEVTIDTTSKRVLDFTAQCGKMLVVTTNNPGSCGLWRYEWEMLTKGDPCTYRQ